MPTVLTAVKAFRNLNPRRVLLGVAVLVVIGVALIALAPGRQSGDCDAHPVGRLALRRNVDPDTPILKQAKAECVKPL